MVCAGVFGCDEPDQRAGELGVGHYERAWLPYNVTDAEANAWHRELMARERKRIPLGFAAGAVSRGRSNKERTRK